MQLLLVHGLGRTPVSLFGLAGHLRRAGHRTRFFGYSPTFETLSRIVRRLRRVLSELANRGEPVGLVGHSLGGILLRMALPDVPQIQIHQLVTLGTPTSVPRLGARAWKWCPPFRLLTRDCGRFLASAEAFATLPPVTVPLTAIGGTAGPQGRFSPFGDEPNDSIVAVSETRVGGRDPELFPVVHTLMMDSVAVRARILAIMTAG